jgi:hypothetical protein
VVTVPRFRIQAVIAIEPDRLQDVDDPDGAVHDDTYAALGQFADVVERVYVEEVNGRGQRVTPTTEVTA